QEAAEPRRGAEAPRRRLAAASRGPRAPLKPPRGPADVSRDMAFDLDAGVRYLIAAEGSDLHLKVPAYPLIRLHGHLEPIAGTERLYPEDTRQALAQMLLDPEKVAEFEAENEVDFSYSVEG